MPERSPPSATHSRWLAQDFVEWRDDQVQDVVIVGSGYGAAMAAHAWAGSRDSEGRSLRMVLLERGRERLPGSFPSTLEELPGDVRISRAGQSPIGQRHALFDVRLAGDVSALVGNGLGGGSLINAGVMLAPDLGSFDSRLPPGVESALDATWFAQARTLLGATAAGQDNCITRHPDLLARGPLRKTEALRKLEGPGIPFRHAPITVRLVPSDNDGQTVPLASCSLCGDCLTGCNVGAKASLDTQVLARAQRAGLRMFTSASVVRLHREEGLWAIDVLHTDPQVQGRRDAPVVVRARKVLLAAGTLGSTEILLRSQRHRGQPRGLALSPRLGAQFSLNGDNMASITCPGDVNGIANALLPLTGEAGDVSPRRVGPEITGLLSWPADAKGPGFLVQEFSVPAPLSGVFQDTVTTRGWLERLIRRNDGEYGPAQPGERDPLALDRTAMGRELLVGMIGHDSATGRIRLPNEAPGTTNEGSVRVDWPDVHQDAAMVDAFSKLKGRVCKAMGAEARVTPNPLWQPLPQGLSEWVGSTGGGALTVHPLGGCPMGDGPQRGVVDEWGAVYQTSGRDSDDWQGSLLVLDGAVIPGSLGANPALTIAALSLRAATHWREDVWGWHTPPPAASGAVGKRPRSRALEDCLPAQPPAPTQLQIVERLWGRVDGLNGPTGPETRVVELTFAFAPRTVDELTQPLHKRLPLADPSTTGTASSSRLRIFRWSDWKNEALDLADEDKRARFAEVSAPLQGHMDLLERLPSTPWGRALRAGIAHMGNAGLSSLLSGLSHILRGGEDGEVARRIFRFASHAGEQRTFRYHVQVSGAMHLRNPEDAAFWNRHLLGNPIKGDKWFSYAYRQNPWNQLLYLNLRQLGTGLLPRWPNNLWGSGVALKLDARFLASRGVPLLRITDQANQVRALADLAHLGLYWVRLFITLQLGHLRGPDPPSHAPPQRLPGAIKGLPAPEITEVDLEPVPQGTQARHRRAMVRLTRYRATAQIQPKPPLVFIHGYSASGTTFAHDAIKHHAAGHFWRIGRDVWILDLRTSAGMPTAREPWTFEDAAWADIPVAIDHIARQLGRERGLQTPVQVDVFAHCIGAVMLSMALLSDASQLPADPAQPKRYPAELGRLNGSIRKLVLSQKGFCVDYTDANILRSYLMNHMKAALTGGYSFRPPPWPRLRDRLYDALLNTLPYPPDEPRKATVWRWREPWGASRRRMDALYERTFNLQHMPLRVLERIDDLFGPLNLETLSQVIHFARDPWVSDAQGNKAVFDQTRLLDWPRGGTLLLSASENGLVNPHTSRRMHEALQAYGIPNVSRQVYVGGHQDGLIGNRSHELWQLVEDFL